MSQSHANSISNNPITTWPQALKALTKTQDSSQKKVFQNLRKITYRNELQKQIKQHTSSLQSEKMKLIQLQKQAIKKQNQFLEKQENNRKLNVLKTQQYYQLQNLELIASHKNNKNRNIRNSSDINNNNNTNKKSLNKQQNISANQFFALQDSQVRRTFQTRKNFELQNSLNQKQIKIKNQIKNKQKELNLHDKQMYNSYIENQYQKNKTDRQLWRDKYLYDKEIREIGLGNSYNFAYRSFLQKQMQEKNKKNIIQKRQEKIDQKLKKINQSLDNPSSSPAYFGIITQSFDRKKQLSLIDRHLNFQPVALYQRQIEKNRKNSQATLNKKNTIKGQSSLPQLQIKKQFNYENNEKKISNNRYSEQKQQYQPPVKKAKQYSSYDFITGTQKTFFI